MSELVPFHYFVAACCEISGSNFKEKLKNHLTHSWTIIAHLNSVFFSSQRIQCELYKKGQAICQGLTRSSDSQPVMYWL